MPPNRPPMKRRKLPTTPPPPPPVVTPPEPEEDLSPLKISGTEADPDAVEVDDGEGTAYQSGPGGGVKGGNHAAAQTPAAKAKRKQSLQVSHALKRMLGMTPQQFEQLQGRPGTMADQIAQQLVNLARGGAMEAIKIVYDRTEGRVPQSLEVNNPAHKDVHERVGDIARERANQAAIAAAGGGVPEGEGLLDLSEDGADGPEADRGEPGVASETAG